MITIIMGILLVSFVSAYTYLPTSDERYVTSTHTFSNAEEETYKFQSHLDYCDLNCSKTEWQTYVDKDMDRYILDGEFEIANPQLSDDIIVGNETLGQEDYSDDTSWLVSAIKKLISRVNELIFGVDDNKGRVQVLEDELCKKDNSYAWCISIGES